MSVILPGASADKKDIKGPLFFLGGPEDGGGNWRETCYELFKERLGDDFCAAIPCKYPAKHPFMSLRLPSVGRFGREPWVRFYSTEAGMFREPGCTLYYVPIESAEQPRSDGLPYAFHTTFDLGEWLGRLQYERGARVRFGLGIDRAYPGRDIIVRSFDRALTEPFKIYQTLEETVNAAIKTALPVRR